MSQVIILAALAAILTCAGCATCKNLEQRCHNGKAELCDSAGKWRPVMDCAKLTTPYAPAGNWHCVCRDKCACRRK